jgi:hypothetical protein
MDPDQSIHWRACVRGTRHALEQLEVMSNQTTNECFVAAVLSHEVLARVNQRVAARAPQ